MIKDDRELYKQRAQVKSRFYYLFWGIATVSVVLGQLYVGSGYRIFAQSLLKIFDAVSKNGEKIKTGEKIKVTGIIDNNTLVVEKIQVS